MENITSEELAFSDQDLAKEYNGYSNWYTYATVLDITNDERLLDMYKEAGNYEDFAKMLVDNGFYFYLDGFAVNDSGINAKEVDEALSEY